MVGRERHSPFCIMHKYVDLESIGRLQIVPAFAVEHVKGFRLEGYCCIFAECYSSKKPVHKWIVRHLQFPCLRNGIPKGAAIFIAIFMSAVFHEYKAAWWL